MGKRNYGKVQKYRRRRAPVLEVGQFLGDSSTSVPLVLPTEQVGVQVFPSDASYASAEDNSRKEEHETEPPSVDDNNVHNLVKGQDDLDCKICRQSAVFAKF